MTMISTRFAVFPILADVVEVKAGSGSAAHWPIHFIRLNEWQRHSVARLITLLDIDGFGQTWEDSNRSYTRERNNILRLNNTETKSTIFLIAPHARY